MSHCGSDGEIRAYLDRELPEADRERLTRHAGECAACEARMREMEARSARIATALGALADDVLPFRPQAAPKPVRLWPRWAAAGAIAAGLALLLLNPAAQPPKPAPVALEKEFVPLDNDPIDAGMVVRVSLGPDNVQADVVVSSDGRPRAYRLVDVASTN
jgi:anti-sigma factor RsiW